MDDITLMANSQTPTHARWLIRVSPWILGGAVASGLFTCIYGFAPASYLLSSIGIGVAWFVLLVLAWRVRSEALRLFSLVFVIFGQQILWNYLGGGKHFEIMQGCFVILAVFSATMVLLRRWLCKFARLEDHVA